MYVCTAQYSMQMFAFSLSNVVSGTNIVNRTTFLEPFY